MSARAKRDVPHVNNEAERATLATMLVDPEQVKSLLAIAWPSDYYEPKHATVCEAVVATVASDKPVDVVTISEWLRAQGRLADVGGSPFMHELVNSCPSSLNGAHYARIVRDNAIARARQAIGVRLTQELITSDAAARELAALTARQTGDESTAWQPTVQSVRELMAKDLPPVRWAVRGLFPEGLNLLAAKPKKGKTTLMMHVSAAVAGGTKACGYFDTECGEVLYLALEDNERRMQKRLRQMMRTGEMPEGLNVVYDWPPLDRGGLDALERYLDQRPATRVIVADTLEHIRPKRKSQQNGGYGDDYASVRGLQQLAGRRQITIVAITHLRKAPSEDAFDEINATMGLLASVDNALVLRPNAGIMELHRRGRDYEDDTVLALKGDAKTLLWRVEGKAHDVTRRTERKEIIEVLKRDAKRKAAAKKPADGMMPKEIALALGKNESTTRRLLMKLLDEPTPAIRQDDATGRYHALEDEDTPPREEPTEDDEAFTAFTPASDSVNGHQAASEPAPGDARSQRSQRSQQVHESPTLDDDPPILVQETLADVNGVNGVNGVNAGSAKHHLVDPVNSVNSVNGRSARERKGAADGQLPTVASVHAVHGAPVAAGAEGEV